MSLRHVAQHELPPVCRTLLIPLVARARGSECFPGLACKDASAERLLTQLDLDVKPYLRDRATVQNILWRTRVIQEAGLDFFKANPDSLGVNLGCGLSQHFQWFDQGRNKWLNSDLPEVMKLRDSCLEPDGPRQSHAESDLRIPGWWQRLGLPSGAKRKPVFVLCEGVLMYLTPQEVSAFLAEFAEQAPPGSRLVLDTMSQVGRGMARFHPTVGPTGAQFLWCPASKDELTRPHPRLRLLQSRSVAERYGWMGTVTEACWMPWTGTPMYAMTTLGV